VSEAAWIDAAGKVSKAAWIRIVERIIVMSGIIIMFVYAQLAT
jgi:hypothetical protein